MAIWDLFSKREARKQKHGKADLFQYDELPEVFRAQVIHIWRDALSTWKEPPDFMAHLEYPPNVWWKEIFKVVTREKGVFALSDRGGNPCAQCFEWMMKADTKDALDLIEVTFHFVDRFIRNRIEDVEHSWQLTLVSPDAAIKELNVRFREHGIGYEFVEGEIIRLDSTYIHAEAVRPALSLLQGAGDGFAGPLQEFLKAHEYYRKAEHKDSITWALKAFESTLKAICTVRKWPFDPAKDTATKLLEIVFTRTLVPAYLQNQCSAPRTVLESGVPTVRNKTSGHGQGAAPTAVPPHFSRFVLHLTASNIVFLIESHQAMK